MSEVIVAPEPPAINIDPSAPKPAQVAAPAGKVTEKPEWLDARLAQARASALKEAGFDSPEAAKKAFDALKAQEDAKRTIEEKNASLEQSLKSKDTELSGALDALKGYAASQMAALSDAQKAAVVAVAGDDAAKQLKTIDALRPTWASVAAPAAVATPQIAPVTDTAQKREAPKEGGGSSPPDPKAVWEETRKTNPVAAARYAQEHGLLNY